MLVLTRRAGERICIGDGIVVTVVSTRSGRIRVGIDAPLDMRISRAEAIRPAIIRDNAESEREVASNALVLVQPIVTEGAMDVPALTQPR